MGIAGLCLTKLSLHIVEGKDTSVSISRLGGAVMSGRESEKKTSGVGERL